MTEGRVAVYMSDLRFVPEVAMRTGFSREELARMYMEASGEGRVCVFLSPKYDDRPLEVIREELRFKPEIVDLAKPYYDSMTEDQAVAIAKETIEEWEYQSDKHGYCHDRAMLVALVKAIEERDFR